MTPETLAAILHRAGVGTWHNSVGPHHETHLEEARALLREPEVAALREAAEGFVKAWDGLKAECERRGIWGGDALAEIDVSPTMSDLRTALQAEPARAEEGEGT